MTGLVLNIVLTGVIPHTDGRHLLEWRASFFRMTGVISYNYQRASLWLTMLEQLREPSGQVVNKADL